MAEKTNKTEQDQATALPSNALHCSGSKAHSIYRVPKCVLTYAAMISHTLEVSDLHGMAFSV